MIELLDLDTLSARLHKVDKHLIALLSQRMKLALQVEEWKKAEGKPILRPEVEDRRLEEVRDWAKISGLNPNFAYSILYFIIKESCSVQIGYLQKEGIPEIEPHTDEEYYQQLKQNLLELTAEVATNYDECYGKDFFSTRSYRRFEDSMLEQELTLLDSKDKALDIGCATGTTSFKLAPYFEQVIGYEISPDMAQQANLKLKESGLQHVSFNIADIEEGIQEKNSSVSLVVMNLGTASDIRNIQQIIKETERVLRKDGRFFFSFYNRDALFHRWFIPWPISLAAEINLAKHCLDVHAGGRIYSIYARAYTVAQVRELFPKSLSISSISTYPTISAILPNELFEEEIVRTSIEEIDNQLSGSTSGAYILATGVKI